MSRCMSPRCAPSTRRFRTAGRPIASATKLQAAVAVSQPCPVAVGDRVVVMPLYSCGTCALCRAGDYIYCRNGIDPAAFTGSPEGAATMAQYVLKPSWLLPKIPEGISYEHASLACCGLGPTLGACERMGVSAFDTVLITGMGPVGLGGIINARYRGARVIAVESHPWRAERARLLGADAVVDPTRQDALREILDLTNGEGVDKAIDCSGKWPPTVSASMPLAGGGRLPSSASAWMRRRCASAPI